MKRTTILILTLLTAGHASALVRDGLNFNSQPPVGTYDPYWRHRLEWHTFEQHQLAGGGYVMPGTWPDCWYWGGIDGITSDLLEGNPSAPGPHTITVTWNLTGDYGVTGLYFGPNTGPEQLVLIDGRGDEQHGSYTATLPDKPWFIGVFGHDSTYSAPDAGGTLALLVMGLATMGLARRVRA